MKYVNRKEDYLSLRIAQCAQCAGVETKLFGCKAFADSDGSTKLIWSDSELGISWTNMAVKQVHQKQTFDAKFKVRKHNEFMSSRNIDGNLTL